MPFAPPLMDLETITLSKSERQMPCDITYMWEGSQIWPKWAYEAEIHKNRKRAYGYQMGKAVGKAKIKSLGLADAN